MAFNFGNIEEGWELLGADLHHLVMKITGEKPPPDPSVPSDEIGETEGVVAPPELNMWNSEWHL